MIERVAGSLAGAARHLLESVSALLPALAAASIVLVVFWGSPRSRAASRSLWSVTSTIRLSAT